MRSIVLVCNMGVSTSLLVNRMKKVIKETGYDCTVDAFSIQKSKNAIENADVILVGPQIQFEIPRLSKMYPDKIIEAINIKDYGKMDGVKVLNRVKKILGDD